MKWELIKYILNNNNNNNNNNNKKLKNVMLPR